MTVQVAIGWYNSSGWIPSSSKSSRNPLERISFHSSQLRAISAAVHRSETDCCGTRDKTDSEQEAEYGSNILKCCLWQVINAFALCLSEIYGVLKRKLKLAKKKKQSREREKENYNSKYSQGCFYLIRLLQNLHFQMRADCSYQSQNTPALPCSLSTQ